MGFATLYPSYARCADRRRPRLARRSNALAIVGKIVPWPALHPPEFQQISDKLDGLGTAILVGMARISSLAHANDITPQPDDRGALNS